jgi:hypothetical protein
MSFEGEHRGIAVGREIGWWGRCTRVVLGLLGLVFIVEQVSQAGLAGALIGQLASGALLSMALYIVLFWALSERMLTHAHPWLGTVIFWLPAASIPFLFLIPWGWGFGVLLYLCVSLLVAALTSYGGCELVAFPSLLFRRKCIVYCPLNAIDLVERRYTQWQTERN